MSFGIALVLGLALSAPGNVPATPAPAPVGCTKYRVLAEKNDLVPDADVAAWAVAALQDRGFTPRYGLDRRIGDPSSGWRKRNLTEHAN